MSPEGANPRRAVSVENGSGRFLFGWVTALLMLGATWLLLGWPWQSGPAQPGATSRGWYYRSFGGGHGGWIGRSFGWGSFGEFGGDDFRGGGPGFGK